MKTVVVCAMILGISNPLRAKPEASFFSNVYRVYQKDSISKSQLFLTDQGDVFISKKIDSSIDLKKIEVQEAVSDVLSTSETAVFVTESGQVKALKYGYDEKIEFVKIDLPLNFSVERVTTDGRSFSFFSNKGTVYQSNLDFSEVKLVFTHPERSKVKDVISKHSKNIALFEDGSVFSWGVISTRHQINFDYPVQLLKDKKVAKIYSNLGSSFLLTVEGELYSFGQNIFGQLGNSKFLNLTEPHRIHLGSNEKVVELTQQYSSTSVLTDSGQIYAFGDGADGLLGKIVVESEVAPPSKSEERLLEASGRTFNPSPMLVQIPAEAGRVLKVYSLFSSNTVYALDAFGQLFSMGSNRSGRLGREHFHSFDISFGKITFPKGVRIKSLQIDSFAPIVETVDDQFYIIGAPKPYGAKDQSLLKIDTPVGFKLKVGTSPQININGDLTLIGEEGDLLQSNIFENLTNSYSSNKE